MPSVFLVAPGGEILWVYSNPDYKVRPENEAVLRAARTAVKKRGGAESAAVSGEAAATRP